MLWGNYIPDAALCQRYAGRRPMFFCCISGRTYGFYLKLSQICLTICGGWDKKIAILPIIRYNTLDFLLLFLYGQKGTLTR